MEETYDRFTGFGMPPEGCADYAFLLHMLKSMDPDHGRGAIILPHGVLFRGGQEEQIRKNLIKKGYIEGIIGLPSNLFYGTGIPACIIILDKKDAPYRKDIFIIDASKGFAKEGNKNKLREQDIKKIIDTYNGRIEEEKYSKNVLLEDIEKENYNLNIPRYIDSSIEETQPDLKAHLLGGIPEVDINKFENYWKIAPNLKKVLFSNICNNARLEGINTTYSDTKTILEGVNVSTLKLDEINCILNLRTVWNFILSHIDDRITLSFMSRNESLKCGVLRNVKVGINGVDYII